MRKNSIVDYFNVEKKAIEKKKTASHSKRKKN